MIIRERNRNIHPLKSVYLALFFLFLKNFWIQTWETQKERIKEKIVKKPNTFIKVVGMDDESFVLSSSSEENSLISESSEEEKEIVKQPLIQSK